VVAVTVTAPTVRLADADVARVMRRRVAEVLAGPDRTPWYERPAVKTPLVLLWFHGSALALALGHWPGWITALLVVDVGLASAAGQMAVSHGRAHQTALMVTRRSRFVNQLGAAGLSARWWQALHHVAHHGGVPDGGRAGEGPVDLGPLARLAEGQRWRPWHRLQHIYFFAFFLLQHVSLIGGSVAFTLTGKVHGHRVPGASPGRRLLEATLQLGLPLAVVALAATRHPVVPTLLATLAVLAVSGIGMSLVLSVEVAHRGRATIPTEAGSAAWSRWQADVSMTILSSNRFAVWFCGGLNFHTEHHFFPKVPMHRLVEIQPVVRQTCLEHGLPYHEHHGFLASWRHLHTHLVELGRRPSRPPSGPADLGLLDPEPHPRQCGEADGEGEEHGDGKRHLGQAAVVQHGRAIAPHGPVRGNEEDGVAAQDPEVVANDGPATAHRPAPPPRS